MRAMLEQEACTTLIDQVEIDYAYIGGERTGGKVDRGAEGWAPAIRRLLSLPYKPTGKASHSAGCCTR